MLIYQALVLAGTLEFQSDINNSYGWVWGICGWFCTLYLSAYNIWGITVFILVDDSFVLSIFSMEIYIHTNYSHGFGRHKWAGWNTALGRIRPTGRNLLTLHSNSKCSSSTFSTMFALEPLALSVAWYATTLFFHELPDNFWENASSTLWKKTNNTHQ